MNNTSDSGKIRTYLAAIVIIVIGIFALIAASVISVMKNISTTLLACEGLALLCLIGALIAVVVAKNHIQQHEEKKRMNPYATVDRKEIDKILDMISREEVRRKRSEDFAAGKDISSISYDQSSESSNDASGDDAEDELTFLVIDDHEDEAGEERVSEPEAQNSETDSAPDDSTDTADKTDDDNEKADGKEDDEMSYGYDDYDDRAPRRRSQDGYDRRDRDPYYDDYYEDRPRQRNARDPRDQRDPYASRERDGVYYNEYGEPVRRRRPPAYDPYYDDYYADRPRQRGARDPRDQRGYRDPYASRERDGVYYNEYGEPVRRRRPPASPYDDRRQAPQRRRRPEGYPDSRPQAPYDDDAPRAPQAPSASAGIDDSINIAGAPAAASAAPKAPDYDENYVPVVIPDDDYDYDSAHSTHTGRAGVGSLNRPASPRNEAPSVPAAYRNESSDSQRYSSYEDESIPVSLPDDDYLENRYASSERDSYQRDNYRQAPPPPPAAQSEAPKRTRDRYVPDYEEEEMVVSLPRDDEYDSYVEKKREEEELAAQQRMKEQRKAERKASGKVVLTIEKIRRRKIRRKSRKYKRFRASVHHLNEYLHSFSASNGNK